jgi:hypothetical protein
MDSDGQRPAREPQIIPMKGGLNKWKLRWVLEKKFQCDNFRIEVRSPIFLQGEQSSNQSTDAIGFL